MNPRVRFKLHFGPYKTPRFKYGDIVCDESRGDVKIVGLTDAPIPWPIGARGPKGMKTIVLYKGLVRAVRMESITAVRHWWGVTHTPVYRWRKALGVGRFNDGTLRLHAAHAKLPAVRRALAMGHDHVRDPGRMAKIIAYHAGRPKPAHVRKTLLKARKGKKLSREYRKKITQGLLRWSRGSRGTRKPWTASEDDLLLKLPVRELIKRTGRTRRAIRLRRKELWVQNNLSIRRPDRKPAAVAALVGNPARARV